MTIYQNQKDCLDLLLNMNIDLPFDKNQEARKMAMKVSQYSHNIAEKCAALTGSGDFDDIYWQYLLLEAPHLLESYLLYMEKIDQTARNFIFHEKNATCGSPRLTGFGRKKNRVLRFITAEPCWEIHYVYFLYVMDNGEKAK